jgi:hypothetical protein
MSRRPDPLRIQAARRAAAVARLVSAGRSSDAAADIVTEWEHLHANSGRVPDRADWEAFDAWVASGRPPLVARDVDG